MSNVECLICGNTFYIKPSHVKLGWGKYCSRACSNKSQLNGTTVHCSICNKALYRSLAHLNRSKSGKYFCSKSCQTLWRNTYFVGEKHSNWLGGQSAYRNILKRSGVKAICICCQTSDERVLSVHHVDHDRQNNKESNLVWACFNCHYLIHHDKNVEDNLINVVLKR